MDGIVNDPLSGLLARCVEHRTAGRASQDPVAIDRPERGPLLQRKVIVNGVSQNQHDLAAAMGPLIADDKIWAKLWPIATEWIKQGRHDAKNHTVLRTQLIGEFVDRLVTRQAVRLPTLKRHLSAGQFVTIALMVEFADFDALRFEKATKAATTSKHVDQASVAGDLASASFVPATTTIGLEIFAHDFAAHAPGVLGVAAELEAAAEVDPSGIGGKAMLGVDYKLGGRTIGGQSTQDVDLSLTDREGHKVFIEVAGTVDRLRTKLGAMGAQQRARYARLQAITPGSHIGYSVPGTPWHEYFERNAIDDLLGLDPAPGLMIEGSFQSAAVLDGVLETVRAAEAVVPGFWDALKRARLTYSEVRALTGKKLTDRLQRNIKR